MIATNKVKKSNHLVARRFPRILTPLAARRSAWVPVCLTLLSPILCFADEQPQAMSEPLAAIHAMQAPLKPSTTISAILVKPNFDIDGHLFTTNKMAGLAQINESVAKRLAFFSQQPDAMAWKYSAVGVGIWGFVDWPYRHRIMAILHSLHGGDGVDVRLRQQRLSKLIRSYDLSKVDTHWKVGFLIHAFGDSFAHVHCDAGQLVAYHQIIGHALENRPHGNQPDKLALHADIYRDYAVALFTALSPQGATPLPDKIWLFELDEAVKKWESGNFEDSGKLIASFLPQDSSALLTAEEQNIARAEFNMEKVNDFLVALERELERPGTDEERANIKLTACRSPTITNISD